MTKNIISDCFFSSPDSKIKQINWSFIFIILFCLFCFLSFSFSIILLTYILVKFLKFNLEENNVFFNKFNTKSEFILQKYGDLRISKLYIVRQPLNKYIRFGINFLTFNEYERIVIKDKNNEAFHLAFVFELKLKNKITNLNQKKWILLEKNNSINISDNFTMDSKQEYVKISLPKQKYLCLNNIILKTMKHIGEEKFFNWNLFSNNCQMFTKHLLESNNLYKSKFDEFIFRDKSLAAITPSEFTKHITHCLCFGYNFIERMLMNF